MTAYDAELEVDAAAEFEAEAEDDLISRKQPHIAVRHYAAKAFFMRKWLFFVSVHPYVMLSLFGLLEP